MTVFSAFLKNVKRNYLFSLLYVCIFILMTFVSLSNMNQKANEAFEISKPKIILIDVGNPTDFKQALIRKLESSSRLTVRTLHTEETDSEKIMQHEDILRAKDEVVSQMADYLVVVEEDAVSRMHAGQHAVDVFYEFGNPAGALANVELNKFILFLDAYGRTHGTIDYETVTDAGIQSVDVEILAKKQGDITTTLFFRQYMRFFHYVFISIALFVISPLLLEINKGNVRSRCSVSSLRPSQFFMQLAMAVTLLTTLFIVIFMVFGLAVVKFQVETGTLLLMLINIFVFGLSLMSFVVFISNLPIGVTAISSIANLFSIIVAFTSGIFVPAEFMPEAVINLSKFFPAYYSIRITVTENLSTESILYHLGMQLLFALLFSLASVYLGKSRRQESLNFGRAEMQ